MTSRSASAGPGPSAAAPGRCLHCGARLSPADQWCGLCHTPLPSPRNEAAAEPVIAPDPSDATLASDATASELSSGPRSELTAERIEQLMAELAASETGSDPRIHLGALAGMESRAGGLLLAGVLGLVLLAGGMLALYVLGSLI